MQQDVLKLPPEQLERGFCHGDFHGGNVHVAQDGTHTFFDFDCCGDIYIVVQAEATCEQIRDLVMRGAEPFGEVGNAWLRHFMAEIEETSKGETKTNGYNLSL